MSKRHQASRRRSYGRRQHELHERTDRGVGSDNWLDAGELAVALEVDRARDGYDWTRLRGLD